jgi:hypothetical protein
MQYHPFMENLSSIGLPQDTGVAAAYPTIGPQPIIA